VAQLPDQPLSLFAISCAGPVAVTFAVRHPERVARLMLYGTFACGACIVDEEVQRSVRDGLESRMARSQKGSRNVLPDSVQHSASEVHMIATFVTFRYPDAFSAEKVQTIAANARHKFEGMLGLRSKTFTVDADAKQAVNFYVWESREAAEAFFTPQLVEGVTALYGVRPEVRFVEIAALVDNATSP
jgi:pimeloyl-ACP methyl ester carboxylesterase